MQDHHFDLIVIGAGPAGYAGAMRAVDFGKKVLLIEKNRLGGTGVYNGVLSSKTMWDQALKTASIRELVPDFELPYPALQQTIGEAIFERKTQMTVHLQMLQKRLKGTLVYEKGKASLLDQHHVQIEKENGDKRIMSCDYILLATGSKPRVPAHIRVDEQNIVTSDGIAGFKDYPKSLVVLGAGVIGCEFATIFSTLGKTKVFLIDKAERILPFEDKDISELAQQNLEKYGAVVHHGASLQRMEFLNGMVEYELKYGNDRKELFRVEKALISVGREANTAGLGLEKAGVKLDERGGIWDDDTQTSVSNIYTAGDVTTELALVNVGEREARHAVVRMFGPAVKPLTYKNISTIMFLNPEVATVGMSEQECRRKGIPHKVVKLDFSTNARAISMRKTKGFFKIIVSNDNGMRILGMRAIGEHASSAIQAVAYLIHSNQGIRELADMMHPHPSIIEGIQECLRMLLNKSIYKPYIFKDKLQCYVFENGIQTPLENLHQTTHLMP
ncbi:MAG TPA: NAD(P)/FAD-dependent oxidoreductase [Bacteroidia bacterium]|nr:NAD(P)/FAD-dependent oxidoreductase [Bacteroidia bacterium]